MPLVFLSDSLLFVGGNLAMHADCCCGEEDVCGFTGTRPNVIRFNSGGCGPFTFTSDHSGTAADFLAAVPAVDDDWNGPDVCWVYWEDVFFGIYVQFVIVTITGAVIAYQYDFGFANGVNFSPDISDWSDLETIDDGCGGSIDIIS
jgi:hypothetical protein